MFKLLRKKLFAAMVNDIIAELPKLKVSARILFKEKKDEIIQKAEEAAISAVKRIFEKELG